MPHPRRIAAPVSAVALALVAALTSCASPAPAPADGEGSAPAESSANASSSQSVAAACDISDGKIQELTDRASAEIAAAGEGIAAGEIPDLSALGDTLSGSLDEVRAGVENSEVSAAIAQVRDELQGFGGIEQPSSLLGAPGYIASLASQLDRLNSAGAELQALCDRG